MTEKKLYTCDICHTDYSDKEKARECEKTHKLLEKATIVGDYKPMNMLPTGVPYRIKVKFPGSNEWHEYRR